MPDSPGMGRGHLCTGTLRSGPVCVKKEVWQVGLSSLEAGVISLAISFAHRVGT